MIKAMDLTKSQESDTDTETPLQTHLTRALSLTNGSLHHHHHHHHPPPPPPPPSHLVVVSYKECLKNHAATLGGLALDGCGEFLPSPSATPLDPTSLKCAACGCHRNFHRREPYSPRGQIPPVPVLQWTSSPSPGQTSPSSTSPAASPTPQQSVYPSAPHMLLALSTGGHSSPLDHENQFQNPMVMSHPHGRKRARTKFTEEQKEKMYEFAEKLGWKMVRANDDKMVEDFCSEVGVKRNVFKVWMHNNKQRTKEKGNGNGFNYDAINNGKNKITMNCNGNNEDEGVGVNASSSPHNGSSPS